MNYIYIYIKERAIKGKLWERANKPCNLPDKVVHLLKPLMGLELCLLRKPAHDVVVGANLVSES